MSISSPAWIIRLGSVKIESFDAVSEAIKSGMEKRKVDEACLHCTKAQNNLKEKGHAEEEAGKKGILYHLDKKT